MPKSLDHDLAVLGSVICHDGVEGMKWYKHKFGEYQYHAQYAKGRKPPTATHAGNRREEQGNKDTSGKSDENPRASERDRREKKEEIRQHKQEKKLEKNSVSRMTDDELKKVVARQRLENEYKAVQADSARYTYNLAKAESDYKELTKKPKSFVRKSLEKLAGKMADAAVEAIADNVKKRITAAAQDSIRKKYGDDMVDRLWGTNKKKNEKSEGADGRQADRDDAPNGDSGKDKSKDQSKGRLKFWNKNKDKPSGDGDSGKNKDQNTDHSNDKPQGEPGKNKDQNPDRGNDKPDGEKRSGDDSSSGKNKDRGKISHRDAERIASDLRRYSTETRVAKPSASARKEWPREDGETKDHWYRRIELNQIFANLNS